MIIVWGTRSAGKVDHHEGQYALTRFAHVYWMPLFPVSSVWVTREGVGHEMKISGKSVFAAYARSWGLVLAGLGLAGLVPLWAGVVAVISAGLSVAWKDLRLAGDIRRSDLNQLAFGTRCEPKLLPSGLAETLRVELNRRWAILSDGQTPSDVARFGTDDLERAAAAYGVLRLTALTLPSAQAAEAEKDAVRIAQGAREKLALGEGGPYRASPALPEQAIDQPIKSS